MATEEKVSINAEFAMAMWSSLNEADAPEAPILAAIIIGQGFEPVLDPEETVDFYREFLIVNGFIEELPERMN
jgi:hypothetical protein